jgi:hypothetical protein
MIHNDLLHRWFSGKPADLQVKELRIRLQRPRGDLDELAVTLTLCDGEGSGLNELDVIAPLRRGEDGAMTVIIKGINHAFELRMLR